MRPIIPAPHIVEPVAKESAAAPVLEPIKPLTPKVAQRQPEQVMLGAKPDPLQQYREPAGQARLPVAQLEVRRADARRPQRGTERRYGGGADSERGDAGRLAVRLTN